HAGRAEKQQRENGFSDSHGGKSSTVCGFASSRSLRRGHAVMPRASFLVSSEVVESECRKQKNYPLSSGLSTEIRCRARSFGNHTRFASSRCFSCERDARGRITRDPAAPWRLNSDGVIDRK